MPSIFGMLSKHTGNTGFVYVKQKHMKRYEMEEHTMVLNVLEFCHCDNTSKPKYLPWRGSCSRGIGKTSFDVESNDPKELTRRVRINGDIQVDFD